MSNTDVGHTAHRVRKAVGVTEKLFNRVKRVDADLTTPQWAVGGREINMALNKIVEAKAHLQAAERALLKGTENEGA